MALILLPSHQSQLLGGLFPIVLQVPLPFMLFTTFLPYFCLTCMGSSWLCEDVCLCACVGLKPLQSSQRSCLNLYTSTHFLMLEGRGGGCCWEVKRLARPRSTRMLLAQTSFLAITQSLFSLAPSLCAVTYLSYPFWRNSGFWIDLCTFLCTSIMHIKGNTPWHGWWFLRTVSEVEVKQQKSSTESSNQPILATCRHAD